jgi:hypothetical protein
VVDVALPDDVVPVWGPVKDKVAVYDAGVPLATVFNREGFVVPMTARPEPAV